MSSNYLVVVGGPPASGKTTIAKQLSKDFATPLLTKDAIKELLFDNLGWSDREWSRKLGATTYKLMDQMTETELEAGRSIILESNFKPKLDSEKFQQWQKRYDLRIFQVFCSAPPEVLLARFKDRVESGSRHPGHVDDNNYSIFEPKHLTETFGPLEVEGELVAIDTNKPFESCYPPIKDKFTHFKTGSV